LGAVLANPGLVSGWPAAAFSGAFNFGPANESNRTVADLVLEVLKYWPGTWTDKSDPLAVHEAMLLNLSTDKAFHFLGWNSVWNFSQTVSRTVKWYHKEHGKVPAMELTADDIRAYSADAEACGLRWASHVDLNLNNNK
jgi:CDP-glucose 4,6-dehydratase